jgi:hypothetical protein
MAIEFHCEHCGKKIKAPSEHAGKRGKCPGCEQSVYIPTPPDEIEPLRLAPVDEAAEREKQRLEEESRRVTDAIRSDKTEVPTEQSRPAMAAPVGDVRLRPDMETLVTEYARCMANGKLAEAEEFATDIRADWERAQEVIDRITMDDLPPAKLSKIPKPVLVGFLKQLRP